MGKKRGRKRCYFITLNGLISWRFWCLIFNIWPWRLLGADFGLELPHYMCFVMPANSRSRTRPFLRAGINLAVTNCLSQQLVPCVCVCPASDAVVVQPWVTCSDPTAPGEQLRIALLLIPLPGGTCTGSSGKSGHRCAPSRTDLHSSSSCGEYMVCWLMLPLFLVLLPG